MRNNEDTRKGLLGETHERSAMTVVEATHVLEPCTHVEYLEHRVTVGGNVSGNRVRAARRSWIRRRMRYRWRDHGADDRLPAREVGRVRGAARSARDRAGDHGEHHGQGT